MMHSVIWQGLMFIPAVKHNDCCQEGGQAIFPGAVDWFLFSPTFHHPGTYSPPWNWGRLLKMPCVAQRWQRFIPDVLPVSWPWLEGDSLDKLDSVAPVLFLVADVLSYPCRVSGEKAPLHRVGEKNQSLQLGMERYISIPITPYLELWTSINPSYLDVHQGSRILIHTQ